MPETASDQIAEFAACAIDLADRAGDAILPYFRSANVVENKQAKSAYDPVTEADRAAEQVIRDRLLECYPGHSVRGEEFPPYEGDAPYTWVLDPIDGTKAFVMGVPVWSTLIGLLDNGKPLIGIMNQPFVGERFVGRPGRATLENSNGSRDLKVSTTTDLADALIATTFPGPERTSETYQRYLALEDRAKGARYGGDAYFYCLLAAGSIDLVTDAAMGDYDIAALIPIIEAAGGIVTTWDGGPAAGGGNIVAAATRELHEAACVILSG